MGYVLLHDWSALGLGGLGIVKTLTPGSLAKGPAAPAGRPTRPTRRPAFTPPDTTGSGFSLKPATSPDTTGSGYDVTTSAGGGGPTSAPSASSGGNRSYVSTTPFGPQASSDGSPSYVSTTPFGPQASSGGAPSYAPTTPLAPAAAPSTPGPTTGRLPSRLASPGGGGHVARMPVAPAAPTSPLPAAPPSYATPFAPPSSPSPAPRTGRTLPGTPGAAAWSQRLLSQHRDVWPLRPWDRDTGTTTAQVVVVDANAGSPAAPTAETPLYAVPKRAPAPMAHAASLDPAASPTDPWKWVAIAAAVGLAVVVLGKKRR
jgi:hypothetical protein